MNFDPSLLSHERMKLAADVLYAILRVVLSNSTAETAVTVIRTMLDHFVSATEAKATSESVRKELERLLRAMAITDSEIDEKIRKKFSDPE